MNKNCSPKTVEYTSIGDVEKLKLIAKKIVDKKLEGFSPVVVVSAMGKTTDELVDMSEKVTFNKVKPDLREKRYIAFNRRTSFCTHWLCQLNL